MWFHTYLRISRRREGEEKGHDSLAKEDCESSAGYLGRTLQALLTWRKEGESWKFQSGATWSLQGTWRTSQDWITQGEITQILTRDYQLSFNPCLSRLECYLNRLPSTSAKMRKFLLLLLDMLGPTWSMTTKSPGSLHGRRISTGLSNTCSWRLGRRWRVRVTSRNSRKLGLWRYVYFKSYPGKYQELTLSLRNMSIEFESITPAIWSTRKWQSDNERPLSTSSIVSLFVTETRKVKKKQRRTVVVHFYSSTSLSLLPLGSSSISSERIRSVM